MKQKILFITAGTALKKERLLSDPGVIQFKNFLLGLKDIDYPFTVITRKINKLFVENNQFDVSGVKALPIRILNAVLNRIFGGSIVLPDIHRISVNPFLFIEAKNKIRREKINIIHTVSFPCSTHLVGLQLKKKFGISWVAQFYDPWVGNPYRKIPSFMKRKDEKLERLVAENADVILHTNKNICDLWIERYGELVSSKIFVLPFNFTKEQYELAKRNIIKKDVTELNNVKRVISYIGSINQHRNLSTLVESIKLFFEKYPELKNNLLFRFVGDVPEDQKSIVVDNNLENYFDFVGRVPFSDVWRFYEETDVLLVIDKTMQNNIFFPSKLMSCFLANKPIIGITPKNGITFQYLQKYGFCCMEEDDVNGIISCLYRTVKDYDSLFSFSNAIDDFSPFNICSKYVDILNSKFDNIN